MYTTFKENKLDYFGYAGTSTLTNKHYKDRLNHNYEYSLYSILLINNKHLRLTFHAFPTILGHKSRSNKYDNKSKVYYTIQIQFLDIDKVFDLKKLISLNSNDVKKIAENCEVQFYSSDESFYWQGFWEDLDSTNSAIYPFEGTKGKGVWRQIHVDSGELIDRKKRITKHIKQLIEDFDLILENQIKRYLKSHMVKSIKSNNKLQETYTDYQKAQLDSFEPEIKRLLNNPKFKLKSTFTVPKIEKKLDNIYGDSIEAEKIKATIKNIILNNYRKYDTAFNKIEENKIKIASIAPNDVSQTTVHRLSDTFKDTDVLDFLNEIYNIKPNKKGHVDVGRGEILFAAILDDFKFSDYGDLINSAGDLLEIKPVNGKFRGSKNFDYNIRNLKFEDVFKAVLENGNYNFDSDVIGNLTGYLTDFRPLSTEECKETYNNFIETIELFPDKANNLKKFFRNFIEELLKELLAEDAIENSIITYGVDELTDSVFENADTLRQTVYKILVAVNYTIYIKNEFADAGLRYIIFCRDLDKDIQYIALSVNTDSKTLVQEFFKQNNIFEELGIEFKLSLSKYSRGTTSFKMKSFLVEDLYTIFTEKFRELFTPNIEKNKYVTSYISSDSDIQVKAYAYPEKELFILKITNLKNESVDKQRIIYKLIANGSNYKICTLDDEKDYNTPEKFKNQKVFKDKKTVEQFIKNELEKVKNNF